MTSTDHRTGIRQAGFCLLIMLLPLMCAVHLARAGCTTIHVTTTEDVVDARGGDCGAIFPSDLPGSDGKVSLREAICAANNQPGESAIALPAGVYTLTIHGDYEDVNATGDLDISDDLNLVGDGPTATIIDGDGADRVLHIHSDGSGGNTVSVVGISIRNGDAVGAPGGGVFNTGHLTLENTKIYSNTLAGSDPGAFGGGGVYNDGTLSISDSEITDNLAEGAAGGGLGSAGAADLTGVTISGNEARGTVSGGDSGGGIANSGQITLTSCAILDNQADESGGGLRMDNALGPARALIVDTLIEGNSADTGGGAIDCASRLDIVGGEVLSNTAGSGGGGVQIDPAIGDSVHATITGSLLAHNSAGAGGGGLLLRTWNSSDVTLVMTRCTVSKNRAASGGGVDIYVNNKGAAGVTVSNTTLSSNQAMEGDGGAVNISAEGLSQADMALEGVTLSANEARYNGGALATFASPHSAVALELTNSTVSGNRADRSGGGLFAYESTGDLVHVTVTNNHADDDQDGEGDGGGIRAAGGDFRLENTLIAQNTDRSPSPASVHPDISGDVDGDAYNLIGTTAGGEGTAGSQSDTDIVNVPPRLTALAAWGGETETHRLLPGSPAVDAVPSAVCTEGADQRGKARPHDGDGDGVAACDIGAYELHRFCAYLPYVQK